MLLGRGWDSHDKAIEKWAQSELLICRESVAENGEDALVGDLIDLLLVDLKGRVSQRRVYQLSLLFELIRKEIGECSVGELRVGGVSRMNNWLASQVTWKSDGTKRGAVSALQQIFNFAVDQGFIQSNPLKKVKVSGKSIRSVVFSEEQVAAILQGGDEDFADFFKAMLLTGCRPSELTGATTADIRNMGRPDMHLMVKHKNQRHTGAKRRIYLLFSEVKEIIGRRASNGKLFTHNGRPWSDTMTARHFRHITEKPHCVDVGLNEHVIYPDRNGRNVKRFVYSTYICRHTFAYRLLTGFYKDSSGVPVKKNYGEVAIYLGDSAKMVEDVYGKLAQATVMLNEELQ